MFVTEVEWLKTLGFCRNPKRSSSTSLIFVWRSNPWPIIFPSPNPVWRELDQSSEAPNTSSTNLASFGPTVSPSSNCKLGGGAGQIVGKWSNFRPGFDAYGCLTSGEEEIERLLPPEGLWPASWGSKLDPPVTLELCRNIIFCTNILIWSLATHHTSNQFMHNKHYKFMISFSAIMI